MTLETPAIPATAATEPVAEEGEPPGPHRRRRRRLVLASGAIAILVVAVVVWRGRARSAPPRDRGARVVSVVTVPARNGDMPVYLDGLGTVTAISTVTVRSRVDGQLVAVNYREGQLVRQGQLLAQIDPRPFQVALQQQEGQYAKDEAALKNARLDLRRYQNLIEQDAIPRQQLDTQAATVNQLEATLKTDAAQVANARLNLTYSRITSPITGRVGLRLVDTGNMIHASDPNGLVVITQLQPIAVTFTLPADHLQPVMAGMARGDRLRVEAWDRDRKKMLDVGTLEAVDNQVDDTTGTVRLKGVFSNEGYGLFSNQFVNARLLVDTLHGSVRVAAANAQVGVATAAFFPRLLLAASAGLQTTSLGSLFSAPSRFWSLGPSLVQTLFSGGRRRAAVDQAKASYDAAVAAYRQSALGAFQEVEDGLAAQRILGTEAAQQGAATAAADRLVTIARSRYNGGITSYLEVSIAETVALNNRRAGVQVLTRRLTNGVALVKALGGGWDAATLPPPDAVLAGASSNR